MPSLGDFNSILLLAQKAVTLLESPVTTSEQNTQLLAIIEHCISETHDGLMPKRGTSTTKGFTF